MRAALLDVAVRLLIASACVPIVVGAACAETYIRVERRCRRSAHVR